LCGRDPDGAQKLPKKQKKDFPFLENPAQAYGIFGANAPSQYSASRQLHLPGAPPIAMHRLGAALFYETILAYIFPFVNTEMKGIGEFSIDR
jgi:hypothetical protein